MDQFSKPTTSAFDGGNWIFQCYCYDVNTLMLRRSSSSAPSWSSLLGILRVLLYIYYIGSSFATISYKEQTQNSKAFFSLFLSVFFFFYVVRLLTSFHVSTSCYLPFPFILLNLWPEFIRKRSLLFHLFLSLPIFLYQIISGTYVRSYEKSLSKLLTRRWT